MTGLIRTTSRRRLLALTVAATIVAATATWGVLLASASAGPNIDLTFAGATATAGGALFTEGGTGAGTGQFDPFLQVQSNSDTEQGYNSCPGEFDTKSCPAG